MTVTVDNPDITAPTVSLTAPASGATVSGTVTLTATASDNVGVAGVQFLVDGANLSPRTPPRPTGVSWNTTTVTNGTYTLTARARDAAGNTTTSAAVTVTVANAAPSPAPLLGTPRLSTLARIRTGLPSLGIVRMSPTGHRTRCR